MQNKQSPCGCLAPARIRPQQLVLTLLVASSLLLNGCFFRDKPIASWSTSFKGVYSAGFSNDGDYALVGSMQHGGSLWRTADAERLYNWNHQAGNVTAITAIAFSPEGDYAVTVTARALVLWDVHQGNALRFFNAPGDIVGIGLTPHAELALLGLRGGIAVLFDIQRGGVVYELAQTGEILSLAISADGRFALFGLDNNRARYWDLMTANLLRDITTNGRVKTVSLSGDGQLAFIATQRGEANIWNLHTGELQSRLQYSYAFFPNFTSFMTGRFNQDGTRLLTGNSTGALEFWDTSNGDRLKRWITPKENFWRPTNYSVVAVAMDISDQQVLAMTSKGTTHQFEYSFD